MRWFFGTTGGTTVTARAEAVTLFRRKPTHRFQLLWTHCLELPTGSFADAAPERSERRQTAKPFYQHRPT